MKWRTGPSGAEGTATRYVDSATGSDYFGDGTRANPYQSIGKAYRVSSTKPNLIVCRGRFSEMLADGNHACEIRGDYYGAATFDGAGYYVLYGFTHNNLIIQNTGVGTYDLAVYSGSEAFAGVGRAYHPQHRRLCPLCLRGRRRKYFYLLSDLAIFADNRTQNGKTCTTVCL